jgi:endonuclease-8
MPEGDTIHKIAAAMRPDVVGRSLVSLGLRDRGEVRGLRGAEILGVDVYGKHMVIRFAEERSLRVHLGMKGGWRRHRANRLPARVRFAPVVLVVGELAFVCTRASQVELFRGPASRHPILQRLGPDLMNPGIELDEVVTRARNAGGSIPIGVAVLDQRVAAGLGNVYKSEVLFLCKVDPRAPVSELDDETLRNIFARGAELLRQNLRPGRRVTRERDPRSARPQRRVWVYGRRRDPCPECGAAIEMIHQGDQARSTYFCPMCQQP